MFAINWEWQSGVKAYVVGLGKRAPYTPDIQKARHWKTVASAQRYLNLKDPRWAAVCKIVPVPSEDEKT
jgi:hypothetical protein